MMTCTRPLTMYWTGRRTENGKKEYSFKPNGHYVDCSVQVPCGNCPGCVQDRLRNMAIRMTDESKMYQRNCFVTLTVDDEHMHEVFPDMNLRKSPFQAFAKRLRKCHVGDYVERPQWLPEGRKWNPRPIRIVYCGEYGSEGVSHRPHYHAILFNFSFEDIRPLPGSATLFRSPSLENLWPYGFSTVGEVNFATCSYVAGYVLKKSQRTDDYVDPATGLIREREFVVYPRGFGLGKDWFYRYYHDVYDHDNRVLAGGVLVRPPKYYDKLMIDMDGHFMRKTKHARFSSAMKSQPVNLLAKEEIIEAQQKMKKEKRNEI